MMFSKFSIHSPFNLKMVTTKVNQETTGARHGE